MRVKSKMRAVFSAIRDTFNGIRQRFLVETFWTWECFDAQGNLKWKDSFRNVCTDQGLNAILDIMFHGVTQITTWYVAIFESDSTPVAGTTYATPGYTECTAYDEANRPAYDEAAAASKVMTNAASRAVFTMNAPKTIYGGALVGGGTGAATKADTAGGGKTYAAGRFATPKPVVATDVLRLTVAITAADV